MMGKLLLSQAARPELAKSPQAEVMQETSGDAVEMYCAGPTRRHAAPN